MSCLDADMFKNRYSKVSEGPKEWQSITTEPTSIYNWDADQPMLKNHLFLMECC